MYVRIVIVVEHMRVMDECIMHGSVEWLFGRARMVQHIGHNKGDDA